MALGTTATTAIVSASSTVVELIASNTNRIAATVINDSDATLYVRCGWDATTTLHRYKLEKGDSCDIDDFSGQISGIWGSATGVARVTEIET